MRPLQNCIWWSWKPKKAHAHPYWTFGWVRTLRNHMVTHTGEQVHRCAEFICSAFNSENTHAHPRWEEATHVHTMWFCIFTSRQSWRSQQNTFLRKAKSMQIVRLLLNLESTTPERSFITVIVEESLSSYSQIHPSYPQQASVLGRAQEVWLRHCSFWRGAWSMAASWKRSEREKQMNVWSEALREEVLKQGSIWEGNI